MVAIIAFLQALLGGDDGDNIRVLPPWPTLTVISTDDGPNPLP